MTRETLLKTWRLAAHGLFWGWNGLFFLVLVVGFGPVVLVEMFAASLAGMVPWPYPVFGLIVVLIPAGGLLLGYLRFRRDPGRLLSLLYGVQVPLMLLCLVRLFAIQQLTWATGLVLLLVALGSAGLLRTLLVGPAEAHPVAQSARLVAQTVYGLLGLWVGVLIGIYGLAMGGHVLRAVLFEGLLWEIAQGLRHVLWALPTVGFVVLTGILVVLFPLAMLGISVRAWELVYRATQAKIGWRATAVAAGAAGVVVGLLAAAAQQPQHEAFAELEGIGTDAERRAALEAAPRIRRGLVGAFLASERWFDGDPEGGHVLAMWKPLVGPAAVVPQALWRIAMFPVSYQPVHEGQGRVGVRGGWGPVDAAHAEAAYGAFFDAPLRRAERRRLMAAARETWSWRDAQAGLLDIGEQRVHLHQQTIEVEPAGDLARITIHDVYRNRTWQQQEVFLSFSLPETAAITGLWLGPDPDRREAFAHVVAPRGAAQEVYTGEVRRRVDPALLEQVGPQQYRLRAFPVEPRTGRADDVWSLRSEGPDLHLWLELVVARATVDGAPVYPLPRLAEARNLFWDRDTERAMAAHDWLPASVPAPAGPRRSHRAVVGDLEVRAVPATDAPTGAPPGKLWVLVDGTFSMDAQREAVGDALRVLRAQSDVRVYCTREAVVGPCADFDADQALFYGARPLEAQIGEAATQEGTGVWIVLTDAGSYELAGGAELSGWPSDRPLWLLHLGGQLPAAYADPTLDALQRTGGGVAGSVEALVARLADPAVRDGYRWSVRPAPEGADAALAPSGDPFDAIAARRAIAALDRAAPAGSVGHLDQVHAVAVAYDVVTPYSSMLVLVNQQQRDRLAAAEQGEDRFDREGETGAPAVTSVPEPGTWLLLGLGGLGLLARKGLRSSSSPTRP